MLGLAFANVIGRYVLHSSISFTEEITTALFVLLCTLGTAIAAKHGAHLGLGLITDQLPARAKAVAAFAGNVLAAVLSALLIYTGVFMVQNQYNLKQLSITLQWPEWIYGTFIPIGGTFMLVRFCQAAYRSLKVKEGE